MPPPFPWKTWLILGGRGSGKTRAGAEFVLAAAYGYWPASPKPSGLIALVGETLGDVREVMIEGPSGIIGCARTDKPRYETTRRRLLFANGAVAQAFSAQEPDSLRGPQFMAAWCDELAKWPDATSAWDMLQFGLRLGDMPRQVVTTTPKPVPLLKQLMKDPDVAVTRIRTDENAGNLAPGFLETVKARYGGTRLGRQELDGELLEDVAGALWTRSMIEAARGPVPDRFDRIVVAVDPPASANRRSDACGIIVAGTCNGTVHVLADASLERARPEQWASQAIGMYHRFEADRIVIEANQGGDMAESVLRAIDGTVPVTKVHASRGKALRAEPVAALYEQGKVRHAGAFRELEDEMCAFTHAGLAGGGSPDRLDALVWAVTELAMRRAATPRVRRFS